MFDGTDREQAYFMSLGQEMRDIKVEEFRRYINPPVETFTYKDLIAHWKETFERLKELQRQLEHAITMREEPVEIVGLEKVNKLLSEQISSLQLDIDGLYKKMDEHEGYCAKTIKCSN